MRFNMYNSLCSTREKKYSICFCFQGSTHGSTPGSQCFPHPKNHAELHVVTVYVRERERVCVYAQVEVGLVSVNSSYQVILNIHAIFIKIACLSYVKSRRNFKTGSLGFTTMMRPSRRDTWPFSPATPTLRAPRTFHSVRPHTPPRRRQSRSRVHLSFPRNTQ